MTSWSFYLFQIQITSQCVGTQLEIGDHLECVHGSGLRLMLLLLALAVPFDRVENGQTGIEHHFAQHLKPFQFEGELLPETKQIEFEIFPILNGTYLEDALYLAQTITSLNRNKCLNFRLSPLSMMKLSLTSRR